jgi:hypothetical protein
MLLACGDAPNAQLADLPDLGLAVHVVTGDEPDRIDDEQTPVGIKVYTGFDRSSFAAAHDDACAVLGDVTASFNGGALDVDPGGADGDGCSPPRFEGAFELAIDQPGDIVIADESARVSMTFVAEPRIASLSSPGEWTFVPGQDVRVRWSHLEDLGDAFKVWFIQDGREDLPSHYIHSDYVAKTTDREGIVFRVPSSAFTGSGAVVISVATATEPARTSAATCVGASRCSAVVFRSYKHAVTLVP